RIQPLAGKRPTKSISTSPSQSRRRHNQSGEPLINSLQPVQGNRATSEYGNYCALFHVILLRLRAIY
ncbi:MAG: hypothetical protein OXB94_13710, partial [Nitrospira sp.]|nr:hypothetical protein [Nitrospira sp.]